MRPAPHWLSVLAVLACGAPVLAQSGADDSTGKDIAQERQRIDLERAAQQAQWVQAQQDCQKRFAVNDCLRESRQLQQQALQELRRQELRLNDLVRQQAAAAARQRIDVKSADGRQRRSNLEAAVDAAAQPASAMSPAPRP